MVLGTPLSCGNNSKQACNLATAGPSSARWSSPAEPTSLSPHGVDGSSLRFEVCSWPGMPAGLPQHRLLSGKVDSLYTLGTNYIPSTKKNSSILLQLLQKAHQMKAFLISNRTFD